MYVCAYTCISAYDETPRKELRAAAARRNTVYIMRSEYWRVRPGRAVSPRRGTGHRLMGQIMVRLIRTGSMFVGLETKGKEGSEERLEEKRRAYGTSSTLAVCWLHLDWSVHL